MKHFIVLVVGMIVSTIITSVAYVGTVEDFDKSIRKGDGRVYERGKRLYILEEDTLYILNEQYKEGSGFVLVSAYALSGCEPVEITFTPHKGWKNKKTGATEITRLDHYKVTEIQYSISGSFFGLNTHKSFNGPGLKITSFTNTQSNGLCYHCNRGVEISSSDVTNRAVRRIDRDPQHIAKFIDMVTQKTASAGWSNNAQFQPVISKSEACPGEYRFIQGKHQCVKGCPPTK